MMIMMFSILIGNSNERIGIFMGMELVVYVKNRDGRDLEFSEVNGCREPNNAVMIDFFGGSNWLTQAFRYIADAALELDGTKLDNVISDAKSALKTAQRRLRNYKEAPVELHNFDSISDWIDCLEELQELVDEMEGVIRTLNVWKYVMMTADIWLILSY